MSVRVYPLCESCEKPMPKDRIMPICRACVRKTTRSAIKCMQCGSLKAATGSCPDCGWEKPKKPPTPPRYQVRCNGCGCWVAEQGGCLSCANAGRSKRRTSSKCPKCNPKEAVPGWVLCTGCVDSLCLDVGGAEAIHCICGLFYGTVYHFRDHQHRCKGLRTAAEMAEREAEDRETCLALLDAKRQDAAVDHPDHYGGADNPYEAIKVIEAWGLGFCLGNTVKYISRAGRKNPEKLVEDLRKAEFYLKRHIANLEKKDDAT